MLLAVDIGNTNITIGVYDGLSLEFTARTATDSDRTGDQYAVELMGVFALNKCETASIDGAILSSVAPAVTNAMCSAVSKVVGIEPLMVGPGIRTGLNIAINDPAELGADLLCASVAALHKYPLPNAVCDLGTASTIFVLDKDGKMIGGIIYPGIRTSLMALVELCLRADNGKKTQGIPFGDPSCLFFRENIVGKGGDDRGFPLSGDHR